MTAALATTIGEVGSLVGHLRIVTEPGDASGWIEAAGLRDPHHAPTAELFARFEAFGFGANRKALAASLLLRHGWAAGFAIGAYLACRRVPHVEAYALRFSSMTLVEAIWVQEARLTGGETAVSPEALRADLLAALVAFTEPVVAAMHGWSRFSRHALWAMAVSSWAGQFVAIGERRGAAGAALEEARALLALDPVIARAAPDLYEVSDGWTRRTCQRRAACCLYFRSPKRPFCASCPILPADERLARNREWVRANADAVPPLAAAE